MRIRKRIIINILIILLLIVIIYTVPILAIKLKWNSSFDNFDINTSNKLNDVYLKTGSFKVQSSEPYNVKISIESASDWGNSVLPVIMDNNNSAVNNSSDFCAAFDVAVTDNTREWQQFKTGGFNVLHLNNQPGTDNNGRNHSFALALVLVDKDNINVEGNIIETSGTDGCRRFKELPASNYSTDIVVTVTENL